MQNLDVTIHNLKYEDKESSNPFLIFTSIWFKRRGKPSVHKTLKIKQHFKTSKLENFAVLLIIKNVGSIKSKHLIREKNGKNIGMQLRLKKKRRKIKNKLSAKRQWILWKKFWIVNFIILSGMHFEIF